MFEVFNLLEGPGRHALGGLGDLVVGNKFFPVAVFGAQDHLVVVVVLAGLWSGSTLSRSLKSP